MSSRFLSPSFRFSHRTLWLDHFFQHLKKYFSSSLRSCSSGPVKLRIKPDSPLIDEILSVTVSGLDPFQEITVMATTTSDSKNDIFGSYGHFRASADGFVDLGCDPSVNGTYTGVEPMGLFWSMIQNPLQRRQYARLIKKDSTTPAVYNLAVFSKHVTSECLWQSKVKPLAHTEIQRWYQKPNIKKISVDEKGIYGSLYIPEERESNKPLPAVIDLYGSNGGLVETRAALLASRGFVTFSLPYCMYKDLPNSYIDTDFEYFEKAVEWFVNHPSVYSKNGIGVVGTSFGGSVALYMAAHCPEVKAAVSLSGPPVFFLCGLRHKGKYVSSVGMKFSTFEEDDHYPGTFMNEWKLDYTKIFTTPAFSLAKVLVVVGDDDKIVKADAYKKWLQSLPISELSNIELVVYPGTGHLIEPPYTPLFHTCYASLYGCAIRYGGITVPHIQAQENVWYKMQEFFRKHL